MGVEGEDETFRASIVGVGKPDKTTVALEMTYSGFDEEDIFTTTETYTWYGSTKIEAVSSTSDMEGRGALSVSVKCDMPKSGSGGCTYSYGGDYFKGGYCEDIGRYTGVVTETYTSVEDGTTSLYYETQDYRSLISEGGDIDLILDMCTGDGKIPDELAIRTETLAGSNIGTATLIITAGEEKLKATAGATPNGNGPEPTGTEGGSPSGTAAAGAPDNTGAAALNAVPALAGLGAAIAAFML